MIGGVIIELIRMSDRIWVNCVEESERCTAKCAIFVKRCLTSEEMQPGDIIWWQGSAALWTPYVNRPNRTTKVKPNMKARVDYDIRIDRIGCSGAHRPPLQLQEPKVRVQP